MTSLKNRKKSNREPLKIWFWLFLFVLFFSIFSYGYFVRSTIVNIVDRQNNENELSVLNSQIIELESKYIKLKNSITPELAHDLGFIATHSKKFVTRNTESFGLSLVTAGN